MIGGLTNHLWQSTVFALVVALLTVAFRYNRAQIRFGLWLSASLKFLIPFAVLIGLGGRISWAPALRNIADPAISSTMIVISRPFSETLAAAPSAQGARDWVLLTIFAVWAFGFLAIALMRLRGWLRIRAAVRSSTPVDIPCSVEVRSSPGLLEPGVIGLLHPVLLLPADIQQRLTPPQLEAVLAHELYHIRRRDNLTSAVHMLVEALFWFHPLVWWIGARLVAERERACDEEVLRLGNAPHEYAEGILNVCKSYLESPLRCVTGVSGAGLRKRIQATLAGRVAGELNLAKKMALGVAGIIVLATPVVVGFLGAPSVGAQSKPPGPATGPEHVRACVDAIGSVAADTVTIKPRVDGQLMTVTFKEGDLVQAGQVLASIDSRAYQARLDQAEGQLAWDQAKLADAQNATPNQPATISALESNLRVDRANVDNAKLQLTYTQVTAPISGVAGLRLIDPGNVVHADTDGLVVINQLQPIAVLFSLSEDCLPRVLPLRDGVRPLVEAWNRDQTARLATGHLTAIANQIDQETGTFKLKAMFDNKRGELFPNQFVNVRLLPNQ
ncbi:MAG: efflux RND transporter periplasmic adaptor subunit [Bryobacteraceae bacterium]|jgi:RND family efflux transporter MFP subunit